MKPLKFFCSECDKRLTIKFIENDKDEERIWIEPCQKCIQAAETQGKGKAMNFMLRY